MFVNLRFLFPAGLAAWLSVPCQVEICELFIVNVPAPLTSGPVLGAPDEVLTAMCNFFGEMKVTLDPALFI